MVRLSVLAATLGAAAALPRWHHTTETFDSTEFVHLGEADDFEGASQGGGGRRIVRARGTFLRQLAPRWKKV
jgi:hypothetical protein